MNTFIKRSLVVIAFAIAGFGIYYGVTKYNIQSDQVQQTAEYTCSMHPEISRDEPGNCPICGMTLVKKVTDEQAVEGNAVDHLLQPTDRFIVGDFHITNAKDTAISTEIKLPGIVAYDPNSSVNIAARVSGRIEKMYVNYKYQAVSKGQRLFDLYSPELLTAQQNFIYLITNDAENTSIIKASKEKLKLYGMLSNQINALAAAKRTNPVVTVYSPTKGIVQGTEIMDKNAPVSMENSGSVTTSLALKEGDYIKKDEVVFKLVSTDKVWAVFNVMQGQNALIKINQPIRFSSEFDEKEFITAKVNFIETQLSENNKSNRIRVYLNNNNLQFPIGLRLQGLVETEPNQGVWINKQSMVSIGSQKVVFVKMENGFKARKIKTGLEINNFVAVLDGLSVAEAIAENAQYLIDSESFIKIK
jgi:Cu(I)/Ag(I) efflux system membrane fusion protein